MPGVLPQLGACPAQQLRYYFSIIISPLLFLHFSVLRGWGCAHSDPGHCRHLLGVVHTRAALPPLPPDGEVPNDTLTLPGNSGVSNIPF